MARSSRRLRTRSDGVYLSDEPPLQPLPVSGNGPQAVTVSPSGNGLVAPLTVAGEAPGAAATGEMHPASVTRAHLGRHTGSRTTDGTDNGASGPPLGDATVAALKRGDPASWEAAYLAYGSALMGYLTLRLGNRDDAADALSETFVRAIDKSGAFRGDAYAFRAWLFSIARNVSTDQYRQRARLVVVPDRPEPRDQYEASGEEVALLRADVTEMRKGFSRLGKADREVLWLRVCSGLSAAEVGDVLGKKAGAVRMQQMRALEALRDEVGL